MNTLPVSLAPRNFDEAIRFSELIARSELAPRDYRGKPANVLVAVQMGMEIGLAPMQAIQNIAVINGRPSIYGDAMLAIVRASDKCLDVIERIHGEGDKRYASCEAKRVNATPVVRNFSVDDAKRAQLWGKSGPWQQYPDRMLAMRARSFALRDAFPDLLRGLIGAEEAQDIPHQMVDVTPPAAPALKEQTEGQLNQANMAPHDPETGEIMDDDRPLAVLKEQGDRHAALGSDDLKAWYLGLDRAEKRTIKPYLDETLKQRAIVADNMALESGGGHTPPEQPAGGKMSGDNEPPPAEPLPYEGPHSDGDWGLPPHPADNPFIAEMLARARTFTSHEQFDELKTALGDGRTTRGRVAAKLPQDTYWALVRQIGEIEERLT